MDNESETQVDSSASGRRDLGWKYACLPNEKDFFFFFFYRLTHGSYLEKGSLKGNPKHIGSIHEMPKDKKQKGKHSPALN